MRSISRGLDCPLADFTTGAAQLFLYCRQHTADSVLWFRFATHVGHFERSGANGRNRRSCILARAVYHSPVYCTASAYCRPCAQLYIMVPTTDILLLCIVYHTPICPVYLVNQQRETDWTKHSGANIMVLTQDSWYPRNEIFKNLPNCLQ